MWFKNLRIYRFTQPFQMTAEALAELLSQQAFVPCNKQAEFSYGWVPPLLDQGDDYVHVANGCIMVCAKKQDKLLPASVIREALEERVAEIAEREGRTISRKQRNDLKEEIRFDLLPRAFVRSSLHFAYIAPRQGWLVVNAASDRQAEEFLEALRAAIGSLPVLPLVAKSNITQTLTEWVRESRSPAGFEFGSECELRDPLEKTSTIRCRHQDLGNTEIINHVQAGMEVARLALTWNGGIDFIIDEKLNVKRLAFADEIQEQAGELDVQDAAAQFDIEFSVMTIELAAFIDALVTAFGGVDTSRDGNSEAIVAEAIQAASKPALEEA